MGAILGGLAATLLKIRVEVGIVLGALTGVLTDPRTRTSRSETA